MKKNIFLILLVGILVFSMACSDKAANEEKTIKESEVKVSEEKESSNLEELNFDNDYLVSVEWLNKNIDNESLLILDARGEKVYNGGHIPGAIFTSWQSLSKMDGAPGDLNWGTVKGAEDLSKALSNLGVSKDKKIVIYADTLSGWGEDGRILWTLKMAGLNNVRILDGGINVWKSSDLDISKETVTPEKSEFKVEKINNENSINMNAINDNYDGYIIVDSRELEEYNGATKYGESRGGHLPGSVFLNFRSVLNEDGTFKTKDELTTLFEGALIDKEDKVVTYCTAGIRSAHLQIALEMAGYNNAKNYDASFYEWAGNDECSIEK